MYGVVDCRAALWSTGHDAESACAAEFWVWSRWWGTQPEGARYQGIRLFPRSAFDEAAGEPITGVFAGGVRDVIHLSHPTGNQNARQAALAFAEAGTLSRFSTALHVRSQGVLAGVLPAGLRRELERRDFSDVAPPARLASVAPGREVARLLAQRFGLGRLTARESGWASVDAVYRTVDAAVARSVRQGAEVSAVYAYEDGALETFRAAEALGLERVYELPIGYWRAHRKLCAEEARLQPAWAHTWQADADSDAKVRRKDEEIALASRIVVPSRFVAETLREYPGALPPVSIVPYGCPAPIGPDARRWYAGGPLRLLFVGGLSQRKGLSYLLEAVQSLGDAASLTIIGSGAGREQLAGTRHRLLGSMPHAAVLEEMRSHDVFVFPSLFEGFGLVITEALAQGMPVIITPACGPADMIEGGVQGWVVPVRDSAAIAERLRGCIQVPSTLRAMGTAAMALADRWTWRQYRRRLREALASSVQDHPRDLEQDFTGL